MIRVLIDGLLLGVAGFGAGLLLFIVLPTFDEIRKRKYSRNYAPLVEELTKFIPLLFGVCNISFSLGFGIFEVFARRRETRYPRWRMIVFHTLSGAVSFLFFPFGIVTAIVAHYFINRVMRESVLNYVILLLATLDLNAFLIFYYGRVFVHW